MFQIRNLLANSGMTSLSFGIGYSFLVNFQIQNVKSEMNIFICPWT